MDVDSTPQLTNKSITFTKILPPSSRSQLRSPHHTCSVFLVSQSQYGVHDSRATTSDHHLRLQYIKKTRCTHSIVSIQQLRFLLYDLCNRRKYWCVTEYPQQCE